jgi:hypothetical protein
MNVEWAFQIFNLDTKSSPAVIKRRYYDLVAVWHPDRHAQNPRLHELASERMKEINSAYETIRRYLKNLGRLNGDVFKYLNQDANSEPYFWLSIRSGFIAAMRLAPGGGNGRVHFMAFL